MLFSEFYKKVCSEVVVCSETGKYYLEPDYEGLIEELGLKLSNVSDRKITPTKLKEMLHLRVDKLNAMTDNTRFVVDWLYGIINTKITPEMTNEENELMKNIVEYMKESKNLEQREKAVEDKEKAADVKADVAGNIGLPINFSKRTI